MDVEITHPAYVRHMPSGGRAMRDGLARVTTQVDLREASRVERVGTVDIQTQSEGYVAHDRRKRNPFPLEAHDGRLYVPLTYTDAFAGPVGMRLGDFMDYLAGESHGSRLDGLVRAFRGTPLRDLDHMRALHGGHEDGRGMPFDPDRQREIAHDGRAEAAAAVRAFLDAEILLHGKRVLRRFHPLAQRVSHAPEWIVPQLDRSSPLWSTPLVALDRLDDAPAPDGQNPVPYDARREAARLLALDPGLAGSRRDVEIGLAEVAGEAARWLHGAVRDRIGDPARLRAVVDGFAPFHMRLRIGALPAADLPEAQRWTRQAVAFSSDETTPRGAYLDRVERAAAYLDRIVAPRLQEDAPVAEDDLAALEGLGP